MTSRRPRRTTIGRLAPLEVLPSVAGRTSGGSTVTYGILPSKSTSPPPELIQLLYLRSCTRSKRRRCPAVQSTWVLSTTPPIRYAKSTAALKNAPTGSIATLLFDLCATREAESQPAGCRRNQRTVTLRFHFSAESHLTDHGGSSRRRRPQGASRHSLLRPKRLILGCSPDLT